ncbi:MAG TPA: tRNA pseudouridine(55) synthase TruB [Desulfotomaculum sp.]|nr:MAG: tRNA pseudouridine synthase B [Desulfotomaculum sp. 46_80]HAG11700.1 tRNA pseudouridine(55) synthase TruB [Desulfotomaculum sp.]HBY05027.1 tRNA pseudouridine(55) synthase TruB [Desulfotomaculum sp.]
MNGILNVLKPPGMTSHDVVSLIRRLTGVRKVGHTGTLDPLAAGVLPVCLGHATRVIRFLENDKEYRVEVAFGISTTSGDISGEVINKCDGSNLSAASLESELENFTGETKQIPPMTSAMHFQGKRLYELARAGRIVERRPRMVKLYSLQLKRLVDWKTETPLAVLDVVCSAGTYIRSLCMDIGEKLNCGAHVRFLLRTRAGMFNLDKAITLEEIQVLKDENLLEENLISAKEALSHLAEIQVKTSSLPAVRAGNCLYASGLTDLPQQKLSFNEPVRLCNGENLLAIANVREETNTEGYCLKPIVVLNT